MRVFIKYKENDTVISKTLDVDRAWFNKDGSWILYEGKRIRVFMVLLISDKWYDKRALRWFSQFEK